METLFIYTRISHIEQKTGHSLEDQRDKGIQKAKLLNLKPVVLSEGVQSGSYEELSLRPVFSSIINKIESGDVKYLFGKELTRLSRNNVVSNKLLELCVRNRVILVTERHYLDLTDPAQFFIAQLELNLSRLESHRLGDRINDGVRRAAMSGTWPGNSLPYGYTRDEETRKLIIHSEESNVVKLVYKLYTEDKLGLLRIARRLNELGHLSKTGKIWNGPTVNRLLINPLYNGRRHFKKTNEYFTVPKIIDDDTWKKSRDIAKNKKNYHSNALKHFYLLRNLCICGKCGHRLVGQIRHNKQFYMCLTKTGNTRSSYCNLKNFNIKKFDTLVWNSVLKEYMNSELMDKKMDEEVNKINDVKIQSKKQMNFYKRKIKELEKERDHITKLYISGKHSEKFLDNEMDNVLEKIKLSNEKYLEFKKQYETSEKGVSLIDELYSITNLFSRQTNITDEKEKRELIEKMVEKIVVNDEEITIHYKHGIDNKLYKR